MPLLESVFQAVQTMFPESEYPCLNSQFKHFATEKPLSEKQLLYAAPLTRNTLVALLPMLASEAKLTLSWPPIITPDPKVLELLKLGGLTYLDRSINTPDFDIILDCCGVHSDLEASDGYIELTRSGLQYYQGIANKTCFDIDSTRVKKAETTLGTGDGLLRALEQEGFASIRDKHVLLFGFGKVGQGICRALRDKVTKITVVELFQSPNLPEKVNFIHATDTLAILSALTTTSIVVTATGVSGVIEKNYPTQPFIDSKAVLINMGAEDEYGPSFSKSRVKNNKTPINFILEEPTSMKFMDPIFTLFNECAVLLATQSWPTGIIEPPESIVSSVINNFCEAQGYKANDF